MKVNKYQKYPDNYLKYRYGLTSKEYEDFYYLQGGQCAICLKDLALKSKKTHIDHNHETGEIRGILCSNCNIMLGLAEENQFVFLKAISYLQDPPTRQFKRFRRFIK